MLLLIIVLILVFGVGGFGYYGPRNEWGPIHYGSGAGLLVLVLVLLLLFGGLR
jgi:hypothetical protein